jgi:hypothetical protein
MNVKDAESEPAAITIGEGEKVIELSSLDGVNVKSEVDGTSIYNLIGSEGSSMYISDGKVSMFIDLSIKVKPEFAIELNWPVESPDIV